MRNVDIAGLDKAEVLAALFNASKRQGMGFIHGGGSLSIEDARRIIVAGDRRFDYFGGRVLKVDLNGDSFDPYLFDRDNGQGAAQRAIDGLREAAQ